MSPYSIQKDFCSNFSQVSSISLAHRCPPPPKKNYSVNLMFPFSNYTYASFPNLFCLVNYWLVLIYDFTVSGLLKIKLIGSVSFHRVYTKVLVFRPLTSRLTLFFLVCRHVINHSKRNFVSPYLHRSDLSCHGWRGNLFIEEWPQDFHEGTFCVSFEIWLHQWSSPLQLHNVLAQKHSHSRYHLNNILGRNSVAKSHSKGPNSTKVITRTQICLPSP